ncbi:MAG TPA: alkene reductase [Burkholderiaceae bacterium]|nr:alkene reductase [Burkholderiaceae bacterium]
MTSLFDPVRLGAVSLKNRVVMAPMTRTRAAPGRVPGGMMREYYEQRAGAGLILTEATSVSPQGVGYPDTPGIWSHKQVQGWQQITRSVHDKGGRIFLQLWHVGRVSDPEYLNGQMPVGPSAIRCEGYVSLIQPKREYAVPRALHPAEIRAVIADFVEGARNAKEAGFDGVEIHAANGYLIDQFLRDGANHRVDAYGGGIGNRSRFLLEIVDGCIGVWGSERVGVHLSPHHALHSARDSNPFALFAHVAHTLGERRIAFLVVREANDERGLTATIKQEFGGALIVNGGYDLALAQEAVGSGAADAVAFGKAFIANPDLVVRLREGAPLNVCDTSTFYGSGRKGYVDYPSLDGESACRLA